MNYSLFGDADKTERLLQITKPPFLLIDDREIADAFLSSFPKAKLFDLTLHSFNPLRGIDYKRARDFASALYTASPEGANTLTVRNGKRAFTKLLLEGHERLDELPDPLKDPGLIEAMATIEDLLISPVLRKVLCNPTNFSFKGAVVLKLNRAELGDFDAFILASLVIGQVKGQVVVPDFGFYGRDFYNSLIRQNRLTAGVRFLSEVSPPLQQALLSIKDKTIFTTSREDAERLVFYTHHTEPRNLTDLGEGESITVPPAAN